MILETSGSHLKLALTTDSTNSSALSAPAALTYQKLGQVPTEPSTDGMFLLASSPSGGALCNGIHVLPIGTATDAKDFTLRVYGWKQVTKSDGTVMLEAFPIIQVQCTTSSSLSAANYVTSGLFCDTITYTKYDSTARILSGADDTKASFVLDLAEGPTYISFAFTSNGASSGATAMNALWSKVS